MKAIGAGMGEYGEGYRGFVLQIAVEQVMTGVKLHFRVMRDGLVVRDWRRVPFDRLWATERQAARAAFTAARALVDLELAA